MATISIRLVAGAVVVGGVVSMNLASCAERVDQTDLAAPASAAVTVEDPSSPNFGSESSEPVGRSVSFVEVWNADGTAEPSVRVGTGTVVVFDVTDVDGAEVGFLSTCFPAASCGYPQANPDGACRRLADGTEDCIVEASSGLLHVVHVMQGPVTQAEVDAAVDLAEAVST